MSLTRVRSALSWCRRWLGVEPFMCLNTTKDVEPTPLIESGWKEFGGSQAAPQFPWNKLRGKNEVPLNSWITADTGTKLKANSGRTYASGFHVYTGEKQKSNWRRVYFRRMHAEGDQDYPTIVAQELFVPSDPDGWPPLEQAA